MKVYILVRSVDTDEGYREEHLVHAYRDMPRALAIAETCNLVIAPYARRYEVVPPGVMLHDPDAWLSPSSHYSIVGLELD